jgi:hypothetical protein
MSVLENLTQEVDTLLSKAAARGRARDRYLSTDGDRQTDNVAKNWLVLSHFFTH